MYFLKMYFFNKKKILEKKNWKKKLEKGLKKNEKIEKKNFLQKPI